MASRAKSNPLLSSYSSCFLFTKHPVQLKTATTNDMISKYVLFKKRAPKQKGGCVDTPPGSATETGRRSDNINCVRLYSITAWCAQVIT